MAETSIWIHLKTIVVIKTCLVTQPRVKFDLSYAIDMYSVNHHKIWQRLGQDKNIRS